MFVNKGKVVIIAPLSGRYPDVEQDLYLLALRFVRLGKEVLLLGCSQPPQDVDGLLYINPLGNRQPEDVCTLLHEGKGAEIVGVILDAINRFAPDFDHVINGAGSRVAAYLVLPLYRKHLMDRRRGHIDSIVRFESREEEEKAVELWAEVISQTEHPGVAHRLVWRSVYQRLLLEELATKHKTALVPFHELLAA